MLQLARGSSRDAMPSKAASRKPGKVPLKPGHSLFHWAKKCDAEPDLAGRNGAPLRAIGLDELQRHSTLEDGWCAINGRVYNVTPYLDYHPGGAAIFAQVLGDDATDTFAQYHSFVNVRELCGVLELGTLASASAAGSGGGLLAKLGAPRRAVAAAPPPAAGIDGWIGGVVAARTPAGRDSVRLTVAGALPGSDASVWGRGAHLMVTLSSGLGDSTSARRPFTPFVLPAGGSEDGAGTPPGHFELLVRQYEPGLLSRPLGALAVGGKLLYRGPLGGSPSGVRGSTRAVAMLAGGTGLTPMLQLLAPLCAARALEGAQPGPEVLLLTFSRAKADVLLQPELQRLASRHASWLRVRHAASDEAGGRLSAEVLRKALPRPSAELQLFVCGPPAFNDAARDALAQLGYSAAAVHVFS